MAANAKSFSKVLPVTYTPTGGPSEACSAAAAQRDAGRATRAVYAGKLSYGDYTHNADRSTQWKQKLCIAIPVHRFFRETPCTHATRTLSSRVSLFGADFVLPVRAAQ